MTNMPTMRRAIMTTMIACVWLEAAFAASPVLTGRWGETLVPEQLVPQYETTNCQALAVVSLSTTCPLARRIIPELNAIQRDFAADGIQLIGLFPNQVDQLQEIAEYAVASELVFPVYRDDGENPWYELLELTVTPEVVLLDVREDYDPGKVVYRGQTNGQWFGGGRSRQGSDYLRQAIVSFLAGETPRRKETAASGCPIVGSSPTETAVYDHVTYYGEIARFVARRCHSCHQPGEPGAELFSALDHYDEVAALAPVMLSRMENRLMPPWHATTDPESEVGGFKNDPRLPDSEIAMFRGWVAGGCKPGDPGDGPPPLEVDRPEWRIGEPDFVFAMPEPYQVPKDRLDEYQYYRVPANFPEDRYIEAIEMQPGNKSVVHHIGAIVGPADDEPQSATQAMLRLYGLTGEKVRKVGDYVAGDPFNARTYPSGYALRLPAGHDLYFEMHYTPTGRVEEPDLSRMGIIWAKEKPAHVLETRVFNRKDLRLLPHDGHYERRNYYMFSTDVLIHAVGPHMHFRGKDFSLYRASQPGTEQETRQLLLRISAYDFNWQRTYEFERPLELRAGEALYSVAHFDNSHYNPNNPDPEKLVRYGLQSVEEMLNLRVKYERVDFGDP